MAAATEGVDKDLEMEEERCQSQERTLLARKLEISVPTLSPASLNGTFPLELCRPYRAQLAVRIPSLEQMQREVSSELG